MVPRYKKNQPNCQRVPPSKRQMPSPNGKNSSKTKDIRQEKKNHLKYFANKFKSQSVRRQGSVRSLAKQ